MAPEQLSFDPALVNEEWRDILGYEGLYQASSFGRIRSLPRKPENNRFAPGKVLKPRKDADGYLRLNLTNGSAASHTPRRVSDLVLLAFVGPRPEGMVVRHLDGKRKNNALANLSYGTPAENISDAMRHGKLRHSWKTGRNMTNLARDTVEQIFAAPSARGAARLTGVSYTHCLAIRAGRIAAWARPCS